MLTVLKVQDSSPMEGLDHLFLIPERALTMGSARLQKDLAGLNFDGHVLHEAPMGNVWICKWPAYIESSTYLNFMLNSVRPNCVASNFNF